MIWTFADLIEHLQDVHEVERDTRAHRNAKRAVLRAYRDLPNFNTWSYYSSRRRTIRTVGSQRTGTIAYDHATRRATLTGTTWPADVVKYRIIIGRTHHEIYSRVSNTVIELPFEDNPGEDVASGASYTLYKEAYPSPIGFRRVISVFDVDEQREIPIITPGSQHRLANSAWTSPGTPEFVTIRGGDDWLGGMSFIFTPAPSEERNYDITMDTDPRPLEIERFTGTDASVVQNTLTVTFGTSQIPERAVGSVLRLSANDELPTSLIGQANSDGSDETNPAIFERIILSRESATEVTLDAAIPDTLTTVGFVISDPIDIEVSSMLTVLQRLTEAEYAKLQQIGTPEQRASYWRTFEQTLIDAKASDRRDTKFRGRSPEIHDPFRRTRMSTI